MTQRNGGARIRTWLLEKLEYHWSSDLTGRSAVFSDGLSFLIWTTISIHTCLAILPSTPSMYLLSENNAGDIDLMLPRVPCPMAFDQLPFLDRTLKLTTIRH